MGAPRVAHQHHRLFLLLDRLSLGPDSSTLRTEEAAHFVHDLQVKGAQDQPGGWSVRLP